MAIILNLSLGIFAILTGLGTFLGAALCLRLTEKIREWLRSVLGEGLVIHDWIFALVWIVLGGFACLSGIMMLGRDHYFWVLL